MSDEVNFEEKAASQGWVPEEEWKGDPAKWRPAKEFVERGENIIPILKDRLKKLEKDFEMTVKINKTELEAVKKATYEQAKREFDAEAEKIRKEKFEAVQSGNVDQFVKLEKKEKELKEPAKPENAPTTTVTPVFQEWREKNSWYQSDPELTEFAEFIAAKEHTQNPGLPEVEFYKKVETKVKAAFAEKFKNPNREKDDLVEGGSGKPSKGKKGWNDLPDEAKTAYNRLSKQFEMKGRKLDKDTYMKEYFEG